MAQRKRPKVSQADIDQAIDDLKQVVDIDQLNNVDRFFAQDLIVDYGKWAAIANAAWQSIVDDGLTARQSSGAKGNTHYRMVKSECIDIYKHASAMKTQLAAKISKFVAQGMSAIVEEEIDELDAFNA